MEKKMKNREEQEYLIVYKINKLKILVLNKSKIYLKNLKLIFKIKITN